MSSSVSTTAGGVVVITHVHPVTPGAQHPQSVVIQQEREGQIFYKGRPMVLGTIQIMIGVMLLLFGITMAFYADTFGVFSGIFVWGSMFYIASGSVTVAAGKSLNRCLLNGTLTVNIIAALVSCTAVILYSMDGAGVLMFRCYDTGAWQIDCERYLSRMQGISGVLAIFNLLELIVSITVAGFSCSAGCCCRTEMVRYVHNPEEPKAISVPEPPSYNAVIS